MEIGIRFVKEDLWVGVFYRWTEVALRIWICLLPMFPIVITIPWVTPRKSDAGRV
jgi:hypothetical protein